MARLSSHASLRVAWRPRPRISAWLVQGTGPWRRQVRGNVVASTRHTCHARLAAGMAAPPLRCSTLVRLGQNAGPWWRQAVASDNMAASSRLIAPHVRVDGDWQLFVAQTTPPHTRYQKVPRPQRALHSWGPCSPPPEPEMPPPSDPARHAVASHQLDVGCPAAPSRGPTG